MHVVEYKGESWRGSLAFRDALRPPFTETGLLITCKKAPSSPNPPGGFRRTGQSEPTHTRAATPLPLFEGIPVFLLTAPFIKMGNAEVGQIRQNPIGATRRGDAR